MIYIHTINLSYPVLQQDVQRAVGTFDINRPPRPYAVVNPVEKPAVDYRKNVTEGAPTKTGHVWNQTWVVTDASDEEIATRTAAKGEELKTLRDDLLSDSDWTQLPDCALPNKDEWTAYRQLLRDVPQQAGFPWTVTWPTKPGSAGINHR